MAQALQDTFGGRTTLSAAGVTGVISDVIFAAGALVLMAFRLLAGPYLSIVPR
jgi:hypothetical protein